ncbi:MAG: hypothetical protein R2809_12965 [Flavobacteriales bacterium]
MIQVKHTIIALLVFVGLSSAAQDLLPQDSTYLAMLHTELKTVGPQKSLIDTIFITSCQEVYKVDAQMKAVQTSDLSEDEINLQILNLNQKKKDMRESRDLAIQYILTSEQKVIYSEKIKPNKPSVLHFGMNHDRASCGVCKP